MGNSVLSLTNPDEVFYTLTAKEMILHKTWMVPYIFDEPQFEKPILIYWLIRIGFILFGISDFGARFFSSFFGVIGVAAVYLLALLGYKDEKKAFLSALILMSSGLYIGMSRIILTDVIFTVFILLSLLSFYWGYVYRIRKNSGLILFYFFSAFAVLTKGPLGFFMPLAVVILFLMIKKELKSFFCKSSLWGFLLMILISAPWYIFCAYKYGNAFIYEFFYNDHIRRIFEAEHKSNDTWYFYASLMIVGMVPWCCYTAVSLVSLLWSVWKKNISSINLFALCWIFVVFAIFQSAHSKLVSYILPFFPALAVVTGEFILNSRGNLLKILGFITWLALAVLPIVLFFCPTEYLVYLPAKPKLLVFNLVYIISLASMLLCIIKKRYFAANYFLVLQILIMLFFAPLASKNINAYLSSKDSSDYLLKNCKIDNKILCSKPFARGINYYTSKNIAIWGGQFFSPHPILHLDSDDEVIIFLKGQPVTYCVLTKSSLEDLEKISKDQFKLDILKTIGEQYIARVRLE